MEQQLQINLSGTIGEKIILEVDHNSEQLGPEATKIKLMYRGLEDEIIKTIETGDVGLTLPGSQLLGYSSNKTRLFRAEVDRPGGPRRFHRRGLEAEGRVELEVVQREGRRFPTTSSSRRTTSITASSSSTCRSASRSGRQPPGERIDPELDQGVPANADRAVGVDDIRNVAVYVDTLGRHAWDDKDFSNAHYTGARWRKITNFDLMEDTDGNLVALDMRSSYDAGDVLAVVYAVIDAAGAVTQRVGDDPDLVDPEQSVNGVEGVYYRMKVLKTTYATRVAHVFDYVLRNIYSLGGTNIDPTTFLLRIEHDGHRE